MTSKIRKPTTWMDRSARQTGAPAATAGVYLFDGGFSSTKGVPGTVQGLVQLGDPLDEADAARTACLNANLNSFICDYATRQKIGGIHLKYHTFKQLPVLAPSTYLAPCAWEPASTCGE